MQQVLRSDELEAGTASEPVIVCVDVGGDDVLLCRTEDGDVVAFAPNCPHQETSLEQASFFDGRLRCARHLYLYDPRTGENIIPARDARPESLWKLKPGYLPVYAVEEREGWIWVDEQPKPPPPAYNPALEEKPTRPAATAPVTSAPVAAAGPVDHPGEALRIGVGRVLEILVPVTVAPGHLWRLEVPPGPVSLEGERFEGGPPPQHRFVLRASAAGAVTLRAVYGMPWGGTPREVRTYHVTVD